MDAFQAENIREVAIPLLISVGRARSLHLIFLFSPKDKVSNNSLSKFFFRYEMILLPVKEKGFLLAKFFE